MIKMLESFNLWFSHWEWSLALLLALFGLSVAVGALALAMTLRNGGEGGQKSKGPKPRGGIRVRLSNDFIRFMQHSRKQ